MVENSSTIYLENELLYNVSSIAVITNVNDVLNVIQPGFQNKAIIFTPEQLDTLGNHLENSVKNKIPIIEVNNENGLISSNKSALKKSVQYSNTKSRSVLINSCQNNETYIDENVLNFVTINIPQYDVPMSDNRILENKECIQVLNKECINSTSEIPNKIVYRILHPEELRLTDKKQPNVLEKSAAFEPKSLISNLKSLIKPKETSLKEPVAEKTEKNSDIVDKRDIEDVITVKAVRTRFGRITKPPQHLKRDNDLIAENIEKSDDIIEPPRKLIRTMVSQAEIISDESFVQTVSQDNHIKSQNCQQLQFSSDPLQTLQLLPEDAIKLKADIHILEQKNPKRKISSTKFRCKTCHKFYLGKTRMKRHLLLNPDHKVVNKYEPDNQLWSDLLERARSVPKSQQVNVFLSELTNVLQKVRTIIPNALKQKLTEDEPNSCQIDNLLSSVLGIPEGKYTLDINILNEGHSRDIVHDIIGNDNKSLVTNILDAVSSTSIQNMNDNEKNSTESDNAVQTSLLNLLDTGQVNFDTTDSAHTSEEVMCVDQLVQERLKTLTGVELPIHSTTNQTHNITLDLSMDLFPYHSS